MANIFQKLLSYGSQKAPKVIDEVVESAGPVAKRMSSEAVEVGPEVIGQGIKKAGKGAGEAIDATFKEITPEALNRMDPKLRNILLAGGAGGAGLLGYSMMGDDELPPSSEVAAKTAPVPEISQSEEAKIDASVPTLNDSAIQRVLKEQGTTVDNSTPYLDSMKAAQASQKRYDLASLIAQGGADIAAGFGAGSGLRDKADYSTADWFKQRGAKETADVEQLMKTETSEQALRKAREQLADDAKMRDPNSTISKMVSEVAAKAGLIAPGSSVSAHTLKNSGINLGNLLTTIEAANARKATAELAREEKKKNQEEKLSDQQRKFVQSMRKELTSGQLGKQYATFAVGQRMSSALDEFAKNPSGYSDYATLMGGLKSLQGDESVVREAEVRMGMSATSLFDNLQNQLQKAMTGKMLQPSQRKAMIDTIRVLTDLSKQQYLQAAAPILEQAQMEGIDSSMLLSGSLSKGLETSSPTKGLTTSTVTVRRKSDGATKVMDASKVKGLDTSKYEIIK